MDTIAQKLHDLTMLYLAKMDLPKDITPAELVEKYAEVEKEIEPALTSRY